jgi:tRNA threonylcarbamoyladenosine biosynthesis protein TsaB
MESQKPLLLSIDTSAATCTIALSEANKVLAAYIVNVKKLHDKLLADLTKRTLQDLSIPFSAINAVAFSSGPGSFTGLRIGASFVKGLTIDGSPKFMSLPTLQLYSIQNELIAKALNMKSINPIILANSGMIYSQLFDLESNPLSNAEFINNTEIEVNPYIFYCSDSEGQINNNKFQKGFYLLPETLAEAAYRKYMNSEFENSELFEPEYIQEFVFKG